MILWSLRGLLFFVYTCCISCSALEVERRAFVSSLVAATASDKGGLAAGDVDLLGLFETDSISWVDNDDHGVSWNELRYGTSTLQGSRVPRPVEKPSFFPPWMDGYWLERYKFDAVRFPQGRDKMMLRVAGAGLGSCLSLPNVGINPPSFVSRYLQNAEGCYDDVAYNLPRRFESFWPGTKVSAIQTGRDQLTPKCYVTGEGCLSSENPRLHELSTRVCMEFTGPTRRGPVMQTVDATLLGTSCLLQDSLFVLSRNYAQVNVQQDVQTFYREILSLKKGRREGSVDGYLRVAGFLPSDSGASHDDTMALVLYDYNLTLQSIDEQEAQSL